MYYYCILRRYILIFHGPSFKCFIDYTKNMDNHYYILVNFKISPKILKKIDIFKFVKFFGVQSKLSILMKYEMKIMYTLSLNKFR